MKTDIFDRHVAKINHGFASLDQKQFKEAVEYVLWSTLSQTTIWVCGNGASASIAQHWACDFTKGCHLDGKLFSPRVISLAANIPLMSAIGNDISFDEVYAYQIERLAQANDLLIVISSSGNSPNIIRAIEAAKARNLFTIGLTGFTGGKVKELVDVSLHVDVDEYEATEDIHQALMQIIAKELRSKL